MSVSINGTNGLTFSDGSAQNTGGYIGFRNRIINGAMMIDQRNAGASVTPPFSGSYTLDRWVTFLSAPSKFSVQQNSGNAPTGFGFSQCLKVTSASAYSVGVSDYFVVGQIIEGFNTQDLAWGTASAKTITLSFLVYSSLTGTFSGSVRNYDASRSYPFTYSVSAANTWTQVSITISGDTTGTWYTTNSGGIQVGFCLGVGSTYGGGSAGSWASANYVGVSSSVNVVGTSGATFYVTGVQLEKGSVATPFEFRPYGMELQLCQRYYEKGYAQSVVPGTAFSYSGTPFAVTGQPYNYYAIPVCFASEKRATPTIVSYAGDGSSGNVSGDSGGSLITTAAEATRMNTRGLCIRQIGGSSYYGIQLQWTASAEL